MDQKPGTSPNPQANATQARTMEHYRRLGFAEVLAGGDARRMIKQLSGDWSAAELPHRRSQRAQHASERSLHLGNTPYIS
jgi:hypothetical protein